MASVKEVYQRDIKHLSVGAEWSISLASDPSSPIFVNASIAYDFQANAKYWYFYVPPCAFGLDAMAHILSSPEVDKGTLTAEGDPAQMSEGHEGTLEEMSSADMIYTRRVHFYFDGEVTADEHHWLLAQARSKGLFATLRDRTYAAARSRNEKPVAFISHDSRDKDSLVRELAEELTKAGYWVWYDEFSLRVGDSLRESIERGLKDAKKCIVVLSPNFFANEGWGKAEFNSVFTREVLEKQNVILPIWHGVNVREVYEYSPSLANKVGLDSKVGAAGLAKKLAQVLK